MQDNSVNLFTTAPRSPLLWQPSSFRPFSIKLRAMGISYECSTPTNQFLSRPLTPSDRRAIYANNMFPFLSTHSWSDLNWLSVHSSQFSTAISDIKITCDPASYFIDMKKRLQRLSGILGMLVMRNIGLCKSRPTCVVYAIYMSVTQDIETLAKECCCMCKTVEITVGLWNNWQYIVW